MIGNPNNPRREAFRAHRAEQDKRAEQQRIDRLEAMVVKPWNRNVNARTYDRVQALHPAA